MTHPSALRLIDEALDDRSGPVEAPAPLVAERKVFSRTISTPPGVPWDQARAAGLEARVGAPLPLGEVIYRLHRLDRWSPRRPGRHVAFYVRARDVGEGFETSVEVDGRAVKVRFLSPAKQARRARRSALFLAGAVGACLIVVGAFATAITVRENAETRLASLEQIGTAKLRAAKAYDRLKVQTRALDAAGVRSSRLSNYLSDLAWATAAKAPSAHIDALHWQHGYMGLEVRGDTAPFGASDRTVIKSDRPIRPGLWLYGVAPAAQRAQHEAVSAPRVSSPPP